MNITQRLGHTFISQFIGAFIAIIPALAFLLLSPACRAADPPKLDWDATWEQIQREDPQVPLFDHWSTCGIKFRFRIYNALFKCLDLVEARVERLPAAGDNENMKKLAPIFTNWLRAEAFIELGQIEESKKAVEKAWRLMPEAWLGDGTPSAFSFLSGSFRSLNSVAMDIGGTKFGFSSMIYDKNVARINYESGYVFMRMAAIQAINHAYNHDLDGAGKYVQHITKMGKVSGGQYKAAAEAILMTPLFVAEKYGEVIAMQQAASWSDGSRKLMTVTDVMSRQSLGPLGGLAFVLALTVASEVINSVTAIDQMDNSVDEAANAYMHAASLARTGNIDKAKQLFDEMLAQPSLKQIRGIHWVALYERARISLQEGHNDEAIRFLRASIEAIENIRSSISFETAKIGFSGNKQEVYAALVNVLAGAGNWSEAFEVVERAKGRALVDLLAQTRKTAAPSPNLAHVGELLNQADIPDNLPVVTADGVKARALALSARGELGKAAPEVASLISVQSVQLRDVSSKLSSSETLINYFETGNNLYALVVNGDSVKGFQLSTAGLNNDVPLYRAALQKRTDSLAASQGLYDRLIRPLAGEIKGKTLTITPHGVLHYLPFASLHDGKQYLLDSYALRMMPSASALAYLKADKPVKPGKLLAFGNPDLDKAELDLPGAGEEAMAVAQLFANSRSLVRKDASKTAVRELGSGFQILHFASHGFYNADSPMNSGLMLAKGKEADGRLTANDLYGMFLDVDLVTLSACETGLGKVASGDDVIGLTRGFLHAGARSIVSSLWQVDDDATTVLMKSFYKNLASQDKREALRLAQLETRETYDHPFYWAAFQLMGNAN